jgi:hypothetical protein
LSEATLAASAEVDHDEGDRGDHEERDDERDDALAALLLAEHRVALELRLGDEREIHRRRFARGLDGEAIRRRLSVEHGLAVGLAWQERAQPGREVARAIGRLAGAAPERCRERLEGDFARPLDTMRSSAVGTSERDALGGGGACSTTMAAIVAIGVGRSKSALDVSASCSDAASAKTSLLPSIAPPLHCSGAM